MQESVALIGEAGGIEKPAAGAILQTAAEPAVIKSEIEQKRMVGIGIAGWRGLLDDLAATHYRVGERVAERLAEARQQAGGR